MSELLVRKIVDWSLRLSEGDPSVIDELAQYGEIEQIDQGSWSGMTGAQVRVGFVLGADPITNAASLAMYFLGPWWPKVMPDLLQRVDQAWRKRTKEARA